MKRKYFIMAGFVMGMLLSGYALSQADEEVREIVLTSRVEQGAKIWSPLKIYAQKGETIKIHLINETEVVHGFTIPDLKVKEQVLGGQEHEFTIRVRKRGTFRFFCFIHRIHQGGELIVE